MLSFVSQLRIGGKFALIAVLALVMVAVPTVPLIQHELSAVARARAEASAVAPAAQLLQTLDALLAYRDHATLAAGGSLAMAEPRDAARERVAAAWAPLREAMRRLGDEALSARVEALAAEWQTVLDATGQRRIDAATGAARLDALAQGLRAVVEDVAITSTLASHAHPEGYALQLALLQVLPELADTAGRMRARSGLALARFTATPQDKAAIQSFASRVSTLQAQLAKQLALSTALAEGEPAAAAVRLSGAIVQALKVTDEQVLQPFTMEMSPDAYWAQASPGIDGAFALLDAALPRLMQHLQTAEQAALQRLTAVCALLAVLVGLGLWGMVSISRSTTRSLQEALAVAQATAEGDLSPQLASDRRDEMGELLRSLGRMNQRLRVAVGAARQQADSVATVSTTLSHSNADMSRRTEASSDALRKASAAMAQLGAIAEQGVGTAGRARTLAVDASRVAGRGGAVVGQVVATMERIHASSQRIGEIIGVIDGIAFQTNILALNAAVEAARAGEQGRGFAVVASEVRALAGRSAQAAQEVKALIGASVDSAADGNALVERAGATMSEIVSAIGQFERLMDEMHTAYEEQAQGIGEVRRSVEALDSATQQNAQAVTHTAAMASALEDQARVLVGSVAQFKLAHDA